MDNIKWTKRGRSVKANASMTDIKSAHVPKFSLADLTDQDLLKIQRIQDRMRMRKNIDQYVHGKK